MILSGFINYLAPISTFPVKIYDNEVINHQSMATFCEAYFEINEAIFGKKFHKLYITEPQIAYIHQFHALKFGSMVKKTVLVASTYVMAMNDVTTTSNCQNCDVNITSNFQRNFKVSMT